MRWGASKRVSHFRLTRAKSEDRLLAIPVRKYLSQHGKRLLGGLLGLWGRFLLFLLLFLGGGSAGGFRSSG